VSSTTLYNGSDRDQGSAGNVTVNTPQLVVRDGGRVGSSTLASGRAGNIIINASDVKVSGRFPGSINSSLIDSSGNIVDEFLRQVLGLPDAPSGDSGSVTINANRLSVTDGALVTVRNDGTGAAGTLTVNARSILLDNKGAITAVSGESGERENEASITLNVRDALILRRNSQISAEATRGEQRGGNITINAGAIAAVPRENSDITASAPQGTGGTITINAQAIFGLQVSPTLTPTKSEITAFGKTPELNGTVQINTPEINLQGALNQLNGNFVTPEQAIASSCLARRNAQQGSFTVTGTGGLPYTPYDAVRGQYAVSSVQGLGGQEGQGGISSATVSLPSPQASNPKSWKLGDPIQEAQGMTQTADGRLIVGTASELVRVAQAKDIICDTDERSTPQ
jgi:large exoprotein involved in heme utilization and adhesion